MVAVFLWVQQLFPNLVEWGKAVCGNLSMIVSDSSSYSCQFCSPYGVVYTSTIWFNQVRVAQAGVVDPCPNNCFTFLGMAATICVAPEFPVWNFKCESWFGLMGKGGQFTQSRSVGGAPSSLHFVWMKLLKFLETKRCLSVPSIALWVAGNVVVLPICFRDVASKIL